MIPSADSKEDLLAPPPDNSNYLIGLIRGHAAQAQAQQQAAEYAKSCSEREESSPSLSPPMPMHAAGSRSPTLTDIKEEPAAKRTQMWLQQLGR